MAPGLNKYRRTGEVGDHRPAGLHKGVFILLVLIFLVGLDALVSCEKGWWPFPEPPTSVAGTWEGEWTTGGGSPELMRVRLCVHDDGTFAMIWIGSGWTLQARVRGTWTLADERMTLTAEGGHRRVPTPWYPFRLMIRGNTRAVVTLVGLELEPGDEWRAHRRPAAVLPRLKRAQGPTSGCDG